MIRFRWFALLFVAVGLALAAEDTDQDILTKAFPPPEYLKLPLSRPLVSELKAGETVDITIATKHCNGGSIYSLHVTGPLPVEIGVRGQDKIATDSAQLPSIGRVSLNADEALRLDRVLAFYRAGPPAWNCTLSSRISAAWKLASGPKNEEWVDMSCSVTETTDSLPLWTIVDRAGKKP